MKKFVYKYIHCTLIIIKKNNRGRKRDQIIG